jgi:hypothetical protein
VDRESASEKLAARMQAGAEKAAQEKAGQEQPTRSADKSAAKPKAAKPQDSTFEKVVKSSTFKYAVRYAAREAVRGMFGIGRR